MKIILDGYNKSIHKKDNQLIFKEKDKTIENIKANQITDITITSKGYITFDALQLIAKNNIKLIATDYTGHINYILESPDQTNITLKKQQYKLSENTKGTQIAKKIIKAKIHNQHSTIKTLNKNKKKPEIKTIQQKLKQYKKEINTIKPDKENLNKTKTQIMITEAKASNHYWKAIKTLLPQNINFQKRNQKPENDILNSMLNYGYAILATEITKNITLQGLDPYCGFLHYDQNNRTSLTYDLIEEYRQQLVDKPVFSLINNKQITQEDIDKRNNTIKQKPRKTIATKILDKINTQLTYNEEKTTYKKIIQQQTKNLKNHILNNTPYQPFQLNW